MKELSGKCHCGKNRFAIKGDPQFQFICYCETCRLLNGGGHLCGMIFDQAHFQAAEHTQTYSFLGGSGKSITLHFCPVCSTQLYSFLENYPGKVGVRVNTLENADFKPETILFAESAFCWDKPVLL